MRQSYKPYRGYVVEVQIVPKNAVSFSGMQRRYAVSWSIFTDDEAVAAVASFPESVDFISVDGAFRYGEKRAQAFIDCTLACESK
jgi:hypothetical protein